MAYSAGQEISSLAFDKIIGGALDAVIKAQNNSSLTTVRFIKEVGFERRDGHDQPTYVDFKYQKEVAPARPAGKLYGLKITSAGDGYQAGTTKLTVGQTTLDAQVVVEDGKLKSAELGDTAALANMTDGQAVKVEGAGKGAAAVLTVTPRPAVPAETQTMMMQVPLLTMMPIPFIRIATTDIEFNVKINSVNTTTASEESNFKTESNTTAGYRSWWSPVHVNTSFNASFASQKKNSSVEEIKKEFSLNIKVHAVQDEMPVGVGRVLDILEESILPQPVTA